MQRRSERRARGHDAGQRVDAIGELLVKTCATPKMARAVIANDDAGVPDRPDVADVDAPLTSSTRVTSRSRIEARIGGRELRVAAHEQSCADDDSTTAKAISAITNAPNMRFRPGAPPLIVRRC